MTTLNHNHTPQRPLALSDGFHTTPDWPQNGRRNVFQENSSSKDFATTSSPDLHRGFFDEWPAIGHVAQTDEQRRRALGKLHALDGILPACVQMKSRDAVVPTARSCGNTPANATTSVQYLGLCNFPPLHEGLDAVPSAASLNDRVQSQSLTLVQRKKLEYLQWAFPLVEVGNLLRHVRGASFENALQTLLSDSPGLLRFSLRRAAAYKLGRMTQESYRASTSINSWSSKLFAAASPDLRTEADEMDLRLLQLDQLNSVYIDADEWMQLIESPLLQALRDLEGTEAVEKLSHRFRTIQSYCSAWISIQLQELIPFTQPSVISDTVRTCELAQGDAHARSKLKPNDVSLDSKKLDAVLSLYARWSFLVVTNTVASLRRLYAEGLEQHLAEKFDLLTTDDIWKNTVLSDLVTDFEKCWGPTPCLASSTVVPANVVSENAENRALPCIEPPKPHRTTGLEATNKFTTTQHLREHVSASEKLYKLRVTNRFAAMAAHDTLAAHRYDTEASKMAKGLPHIRHTAAAHIYSLHNKGTARIAAESTDSLRWNEGDSFGSVVVEQAAAPPTHCDPHNGSEWHLVVRKGKNGSTAAKRRAAAAARTASSAARTASSATYHPVIDLHGQRVSDAICILQSELDGYQKQAQEALMAGTMPEGDPWSLVHIITGRGVHAKDGVSRLNTHVKQYLATQSKLPWRVTSPGSFLVAVAGTYSGAP